MNSQELVKKINEYHALTNEREQLNKNYAAFEKQKKRKSTRGITDLRRISDVFAETIRSVRLSKIFVISIRINCRYREEIFFTEERFLPCPQ